MAIFNDFSPSALSFKTSTDSPPCSSHLYGMLSAHNSTLRLSVVTCLLLIAQWRFATMADARHLWRGYSLSSQQNKDFSANFTQTEARYPDQLLDHFNPLSSERWSQRYFVVSDFWANNSAPVLLYICGEATCNGVKPSGEYIVQVAFERCQSFLCLMSFSLLRAFGLYFIQFRLVLPLLASLSFSAF